MEALVSTVLQGASRDTLESRMPQMCRLQRRDVGISQNDVPGISLNRLLLASGIIIGP